MLVLTSEDGTAIYGIKDNLVVYIIKRAINFPHKWVAKDTSGVVLAQPNTFRYDLIEELECKLCN